MTSQHLFPRPRPILPPERQPRRDARDPAVAAAVISLSTLESKFEMWRGMRQSDAREPADVAASPHRRKPRCARPREGSSAWG